MPPPAARPENSPRSPSWLHPRESAFAPAWRSPVKNLLQQISSAFWRKAALRAADGPMAARSWASRTRLNSVAYGAKTRKGFGPLVARGAADDAQRTLTAEPQPLHDGHRRIVLAAGRLDPRFIAGLAVDADRFGHGDPAVAHAGDCRCDLLGKAAAIVGCRRHGTDQADNHERRRLKAGRLVAVGDDDGRTRRQRTHILEIAEIADLERQQAELFVDRNFLAHDGRRKHLPHGIVGINLRGIFRHLNGDVAGECVAGHDHRIAPYAA